MFTPMWPVGFYTHTFVKCADDFCYRASGHDW